MKSVDKKKQIKALEQLEGRLYNWKFKSACSYLKVALPDNWNGPEHNMAIKSCVLTLGGILGNCGWSDSDITSDSDVALGKWVASTVKKLEKMRKEIANRD